MNTNLASSSSSPPAAAAAASDGPPPPATTSLAPGFRFHPTDEELVSYYLKRKVLGRPLKMDAIAEVDLYKVEPWDLPPRSRLRSRDAEWYFFSPLDRKHSNRARTNRATSDGYWKTTGKDREVRRGPRIVGMKKTLVFHVGRAPRGERTNWVMHEYRLEGEEAAQAGITQDSYVVCRIFQKSGPGPQNGAQYGAPFVEEEWEEEEEGLMPVENVSSPHDEDQVVGAGDNAYLQMNDFLVESGVADTFSAPLFDVPNENSNHSEDVDTAFGDLLNDPNFIVDALGFTGDPEEQKISSLNQSMVENAGLGDFSRNSSQSDGFMELKDFADNVKIEYLSSDDSVDWSSELWDFSEEPVSGVDGTSNLQGQSQDFGNIVADNTFQPDELQQCLQLTQENPQMNPSGKDASPSSEITHFNQADDCQMFYDAPNDPAANPLEDDLGQLNEFFNWPIENLYGIDMVGDMPYFDAMDDSLISDILGSEQQLAVEGPKFAQQANTSYNSNGTQSSFEPNVLFDAQSPAVLPEVDGQVHFRKDKYMFVPDGQRSKNPISNQLVKILDSVSAPPAFAAEFPVRTLRAGMAIPPATHPNSVRVSAEMIGVGTVTVPGSTENWPLQKNEGFEFVISEGCPKKHCGCHAISMVLRGGFCLFFLSAMMLLLSYGVGVCIYSK